MQDAWQRMGCRVPLATSAVCNLSDISRHCIAAGTFITRVSAEFQWQSWRSVYHIPPLFQFQDASICNIARAREN